MSATASTEVFAERAVPARSVSGRMTTNIFTAVAAGEVAIAQRRPQRGADVGQGLIPDRVSETFVDVSEVVEIDQ